MCSVYFPTRRGPLAWFSRKWELMNIAATLRWAESDRDHLANELKSLPKRIRQLDRDVDRLQARQAVLRGSR